MLLPICRWVPRYEATAPISTPTVANLSVTPQSWAALVASTKLHLASMWLTCAQLREIAEIFPEALTSTLPTSAATAANTVQTRKSVCDYVRAHCIVLKFEHFSHRQMLAMTVTCRCCFVQMYLKKICQCITRMTHVA